MSREIMLASIRERLGVVPEGEPSRRAAVTARLASPPAHPLPARATKERPALVRDFKERLRAQLAVVEELPGAGLIPAAVARVLDAAHVRPEIRLGMDPRLLGLPWDAVSMLTCLYGAAHAADVASLVHAAAGIAETGTLVIASGADNPVTLSFLPEISIVAIAEDTIVGSLEEGFAAARAMNVKGQMPRTLNLVSAASRTGDIGGRLVMGAHGPRQLVVLVYRQGEGATRAP